MGSGVSGWHERRNIKFRRRHSLVSSAVRELPLRLSPEWVCLHLQLSPSSSVSVLACLRLRLSPSSTVSVFVCLRPRLSPSSSISVFVCLRRSAKWLVQRVSVVCPIFYIEGVETTVSCVFTVYAVFRGVWFDTTGELIVKRPLLCCDVLPSLTSNSSGRVLPHIKLNHFVLRVE